jgi:hypothetical protein
MTVTPPVPSHTQEDATRIRWSPAKRDFYEVNYTMWWDTKNGVFGWVRYMLFNSRRRGSEAAVWAGVIPLDDPASALTVKQLHPIGDVQVSDAPVRLSIGGSVLRSGFAEGAIGAGDTAVSWSIGFEDPGIDIAHLPSMLRNLPIPPTKFVSGFCGGRLAGFIDVAGQRYEFSGASAVQSHFWGPKNVVGWSWGHCSSFREDPSFVFDGVFVDSKLAGMRAKPMSIFFFRMDGKTYRCNGLLTALFRNASESDVTGWRFTAENQGVVFRGTVVADPRRMNLWLHEDPDGEERKVHTTMTADYRIEMFRRDGDTLRPIRTVTSPGSGIFEISLPAVDDRVAHRHPTHLLKAS